MGDGSLIKIQLNFAKNIYYIKMQSEFDISK